MPETKRLLKVFLCHAHSDKADVKALYERLVADGVDAWLDKEKLLPGQDWELEIRKAVRESDVIVVCLSKQFNNAGFRQKEVRLALDTAMEKPEGEIFIIPARLEVCESLESLKKWHWVDLFEENGYDMLMKALRARADGIGATLQAKRSRTPGISSRRVKPERPIEEDRSAATSSDEARAKEADIDTQAKASRIPSISARKPFRLKTEYIVAIIGAAATIIAAVISSPLIERWFTQTPLPTVTVTTQALVSLTGSSVTILPSETLLPAQPDLSPGSPLQPGTTVQHQVVSGESLFQIARCYGVDFGMVLTANPQISDPRNLSSVTVVTVPNIGSAGKVYGPPCISYYTVQSGDTWNSIASRYNADLAVLMEANKNVPLKVGLVITIPSNSAPTFTIPPSLLSTLFKKDVDLLPNRPDCSGWGLLTGQVLYFKTTTSTDVVTHIVHSPDESVVKDTGILILYGSLNSETDLYDYCIFNRSSSTVSFTLEVSLSR